MIKIKSIKKVTIMSDPKLANPRDEKIIFKKISGLKFS
jgi:hypothetical protein